MPTPFLKLDPFPGTKHAPRETRHLSLVTGIWIGLVIGCALTTAAFVLLTR